MHSTDTSSLPSGATRPGSKKSLAILVIAGACLLGFVVGVGTTSYFIPHKLVQMIEENAGPEFMVSRIDKSLLGPIELNPDQQELIRLELEKLRSELGDIRQEIIPKILDLTDARLARIESILDEDQATQFRGEAEIFTQRLREISQR